MDTLFNLGASATTPVPLATVVINLLLTFVMAVVIGFVYKRTHRGLSYSQTFVLTLVMTAMVVAVIMMVVGSNLAYAFGILGAVALIRFRTPVKDTKDTGYLFLSLATGLAIGTGNYTVGIIGPMLILLAIALLERLRFGSIRTHQYLLSFVLRQENGPTNAYETVFRNYLKHSALLNINSVDGGKASELTYHVNFSDAKRQADFVRDLSGLAGVERVHLITSRDDVEY